MDKKLLKKGTEKAIEFINQLLPLSNKDKRQNNVIKQKDSIYISDITFNKLDNFTRAYILGKLKIKKNTVINHEQLEKGISLINGTQNFSTIMYSFEKIQNGEQLNLQLKENKNNTFLKFGLHYDDLYKSGVLLNYTQKKTLYKKRCIFFRCYARR